MVLGELLEEAVAPAIGAAVPDPAEQGADAPPAELAEHQSQICQQAIDQWCQAMPAAATVYAKLRDRLAARADA